MYTKLKVNNGFVFLYVLIYVLIIFILLNMISINNSYYFKKYQEDILETNYKRTLETTTTRLLTTLNVNNYVGKDYVTYSSKYQYKIEKNGDDYILYAKLITCNYLLYYQKFSTRYINSTNPTYIIYEEGYIRGEI